MCDLAELKVTKEPPYAPLVLDACCGTGGFLIEAMAKLTRQLKDGPLAILNDQEKRKIDQAIRDERLIGIDAGKDPPVARIARINMYLHGDGGSKIYSADALDKQVRIPSTASPELRGELRQLRALFSGPNATQVDVVLTNPPFSMKKEMKEADQREILQEYESAFTVKDLEENEGMTKKRSRGRPARPMPPSIDAPPEEVARVILTTSKQRLDGGPPKPAKNEAVRLASGRVSTFVYSSHSNGGNPPTNEATPTIGGKTLWIDLDELEVQARSMWRVAERLT